MKKVSDEPQAAARMTVLAIAAMWARQRLAVEMITLNEPLTDMPRDLEIGIRAIVAEAALVLGPVYGDLPVTTEEALDLLEETAASADNEVYVIANRMRRPV